MKYMITCTGLTGGAWIKSRHHTLKGAQKAADGCRRFSKHWNPKIWRVVR